MDLKQDNAGLFKVTIAQGCCTVNHICVVAQCEDSVISVRKCCISWAFVL